MPALEPRDGVSSCFEDSRAGGDQSDFDGALVLMRIALELLDKDDDQLDPEIVRIMREGAIQRFKYTFELA